ncbi:DUF3429 family protein [Erythrobacter aquimaris]|uniref:DUF3429 family protein n=1 Tax=Qipengyuania aquimaris TaxID=255984 RepID=A0A6I4TPP8_9SPHN|nr:DUF3429 domain-containing protein [Qipengyuania aquimaris]MXO97259.1 DUF3429 family protein [Qipengyuania aquimaris]
MREIPSYPKWLGLAGLLPQLACVAIVLFGPEAWHEAARGVAAFYAALILSFLGGMWWGLAAGAPAAERRSALRWVWIAAVTPSLVALACLAPMAIWAIATEPALVMLGAALLISLGVDARLGQLAPPWWMHLRVPLSVILGSATLAVALA